MVDRLPTPANAALPTTLVDAVDKAQAYAEQSLSLNTRKRYASAWRGFVAWCESRGASALPADPAVVAGFLADSSSRPVTLGVALAAIRLAHTSQSEEDPTKAEVVRLTMRGIRRERGTAQQGKRALRLPELRRLLEACRADANAFIGRRDAALLLVGFVGGLRRTELCSINWLHFRKTEEGVLLTIPRSKTDQEGEGRTVALPYGRTRLTCPVRTLEAWGATVRARGSGVLLPEPEAVFLSSKTLKRLPPARVATLLRARAQEAGVNSALLSAHSLRVGFATEAALAGASERAIANQTGHRDLKTLRKYIRAATVFVDNAATKLDL